MQTCWYKKHLLTKEPVSKIEQLEMSLHQGKASLDQLDHLTTSAEIFVSLKSGTYKTGQMPDTHALTTVMIIFTLQFHKVHTVLHNKTGQILNILGNYTRISWWPIDMTIS